MQQSKTIEHQRRIIDHHLTTAPVPAAQFAAATSQPPPPFPVRGPAAQFTPAASQPLLLHTAQSAAVASQPSLLHTAQFVAAPSQPPPSFPARARAAQFAPAASQPSPVYPTSTPAAANMQQRPLPSATMPVTQFATVVSQSSPLHTARATNPSSMPPPLSSPMDNTNPPVQQSNTRHRQKLTVRIIGDSMLNRLESNSIRNNLEHDAHVTIAPNPGFTTEDLVSVIKPHAQRQPDFIILHGGTNDINATVTDSQGVPHSKPINTIANLKAIRAEIAQSSPRTELVISLPTIRDDNELVSGRPGNRDIRKRTDQLKRSIYQYCARENIRCIRHDNFLESHLGRGRLHPNGPGKQILTTNFSAFINSL
jgi:hypothetical protein